MNITLSANSQLIERSRAYAKTRGTSLNQLVRDYLEQLDDSGGGAAAAQEFAELALRQPGRSPDGYVFDRAELHTRG